MADLQISEIKDVRSVHQYVVAVGGGGTKKSPTAGKKYHFIGSGGVGMSGLAMLLIKEKANVSGSDMNGSAITEKLRNAGADIKIGHHSDNIPEDVDAIVISAAIKDDNPELAKAKAKSVMIYKYAQMLGLIMDRYKAIAIAGTHGKSTTGGWLAYAMSQMEADPNFVIGADIIQLGASCGIGKSSIFIAEACEYDRSFLNLHPKIGVLLNIEQDHLDYYKDEDEIVEAFARFASGVAVDGTVVAGTADKNVRKVVASMQGSRKIVTFGIGDGFDYSARDIDYRSEETEFGVFYKGGFVGRTTIQLPGAHSVSNAMAVIAAGVEAGLEIAKLTGAISGFVGMDRRMMEKGRAGGVVVLDDYAHHPTEIRATLAAVRQKYQQERIICVFQPHQYSRTRFLLADFAESFKGADLTIVPEIYFVRDTAESKAEVNAEKLVSEIMKNGSEAIFIDSFERICEYLKSNVKSGDVVITMGAGDIWKVADEYIRWFEGRG
ncbi:MAG: UDP-N-acetylmuramate--L-alanine ligase [Anaerohalosphaeraceae bacterium]|nr:UDP-N-acetylmuramate--L-alanine ligase [Anaerohalosphaeraceae bacterium]